MLRRTWIYVIAFSILLIGCKYFAIFIDGFEAVFIFLLAVFFGFLLCCFALFGAIRLVFHKEARFIYPTAAAVFVIIFAVFEPIEYVVEKMKSPPVFAGYCEHTVTAVWILMRADKTFEYGPGSFLTNDTRFGTYSRANDTIFLHFKDSVPKHAKTELIFKKAYDGSRYLGEVGDTTKHLHGFKITLDKLK
ncbi:MAG: hypothetical protein EOO50_04025 [Flavobacterium sp.]|uniref:hypothetical protein n=1 Tax=Flavobacterium sp. TaxID=239 RepID=UPI00120B5A6B|nr:hypothetical protein [Flavobacterium sp.]RZJ67751.1 MAG: hypothetical protein EOO50_04025 [Flavobacterium sp.]